MTQDRVKGADGLGIVWSRMSLPITLLATIVLPILIGFFRLLQDYGRADAAAVAFGIVLASILVAHWGDRHPDLNSRTGEVLSYMAGMSLGGVFASIPVMMLGMFGGLALEDSMSEAKARLIATIIAGVLCVVAYLIYIAVKGTQPSRDPEKSFG